MSNNKDPEIRYCKKCRCELVSTNKHKLCDNCRRKRSENIKNGGGAGVGVAAVLVWRYFNTKGKHGGGGNKA